MTYDTRASDWSPSSTIAASVASGPIFLLSLGAATLYREIPKPIEIEFLQAVSLLMLAVPASIVGLFLSMLPNLCGTFALQRLGGRVALTRAVPIWIAVGGGFGWVIASLVGALDNPNVTFALVFTSAACAYICRRGVQWN
jgi:hypothetical protein